MALGAIEARLQVVHDIVDRVPATFVLPSRNRRFATSDELGLHTTPSCGRDDSLLDELGQRLALAQYRLDLGPDLGLDTNGGDGGRAHCESV